MLKIKSGRYGARLSEIQAICAMMMVVNEVLKDLGIGYELSSGIEGEHMIKSLHPCGHALDFALRHNINGLGKAARDAINERLGEDFDVTYNIKKRVIHAEWQMKRPLGKL
ncbi:MAG: hypothetical protein V3W44_09815, partial [Dehalococcoidales bacterium]